MVALYILIAFIVFYLVGVGAVFFIWKNSWLYELFSYPEIVRLSLQSWVCVIFMGVLIRLFSDPERRKKLNL